MTIPRWLVAVILIILFIVWTGPIILAALIYLIVRRLRCKPRSTTRTGRR